MKKNCGEDTGHLVYAGLGAFARLRPQDSQYDAIGGTGVIYLCVPAVEKYYASPYKKESPMTTFFGNTTQLATVVCGKTNVSLPILYHRDDAFGLYFTADYERVKAVMPSDRLHPVVLPGNRAIMAMGIFNYIDTSIGPYGEVAVALPAVFDKKITAFNGWFPALMESAYPGFGVVVMHLPVTTQDARDAGRREWGYTKFIADMRFTITPEYFECRMHEDDRHILDIRVKKRGIYLRNEKSFTTFSVKNGNLIKTTISQTATKRVSLKTAGSYLKLGDHPMAESIRRLKISSRPFMSVYYPERSAILPPGKVIEKKVRPLEGHRGVDRKAIHSIEYPGTEKRSIS